MNMTNSIKQASLICIGCLGGLLIGLHFSAMAEKEVRNALPVKELRTFAEVFGAIKHGYVEPVEDKQLIAHAISGMLSNLDPHSAYLDTDSFKELQVGSRGEFGGIGIEVGMEDGLVKVVSPMEDTPADRAGIRSGDLIFKIDDTMVKGMTLTDAVKLMRGKPRTEIRLSILRKNENRPIEVTLRREVIKVQSVKSRMLDEGYGYLRVAAFQENTAPSVVKHLNDLLKPGVLKGLVLDLRNDPGGLLHSAVGVSSAFLPPKTLVTSTDGRVPDAKHLYYTLPEDYLRNDREKDYIKSLPAEAYKVPIVVLINGGSASASEIVAGALQDHKRAVIMGTASFGKGSVQSIVPLPGDTAIKLTTARYFTPSGRSIQAKGIEPDIVVGELEDGASVDRLREADLDHHLGNDKDSGLQPAKPRAPAKSKTKPANDASSVAPEPSKTKKDYQLDQALNLLKGLQIVRNSGI